MVPVENSLIPESPLALRTHAWQMNKRVSQHVSHRQIRSDRRRQSVHPTYRSVQRPALLAKPMGLERNRGTGAPISRLWVAVSGVMMIRNSQKGQWQSS